MGSDEQAADSARCRLRPSRLVGSQRFAERFADRDVAVTEVAGDRFVRNFAVGDVDAKFKRRVVCNGLDDAFIGNLQGVWHGDVRQGDR